MAVRHVTLTANTPATVALNRDLREIGFLHKANVVDPIYVRTDGVDAVVAGDDTYCILPGQQRWVPRIWSQSMPTSVSIISLGAVDVEVEYP